MSWGNVREFYIAWKVLRKFNSSYRMWSNYGPVGWLNKNEEYKSYKWWTCILLDSGLGRWISSIVKNSSCHMLALKSHLCSGRWWNWQQDDLLHYWFSNRQLQLNWFFGNKTYSMYKTTHPVYRYRYRYFICTLATTQSNSWQYTVKVKKTM